MGQLNKIEQEIVNYLVDKNYVSQEAVEEALKIKKNYDAKIGNILLNLGVLKEEYYLEALSNIFNLPLLKNEDIEIEVIYNDKKYLFKELGIYPFKKENNAIFFCITYDIEIDSIIQISNIFNEEIKFFLVTKSFFENVKNLYEEEIDNLDISDVSDEIEKLKELASEVPVIKMINTHFNKALEMNASDIHYEAFKKGMKVRMRVDGVLVNFDIVPLNLKNAVIARLKLLSKMNIAENRLPQDGRISIKFKNREIDIRSSSIPTEFGESFVLRLLKKESIEYKLESLGFYSDQLSILRDIIKKPHGIFLTTGPTGSGKTTTLYSIINELNSDEVKIVTVEDPVEYELEGINQINVKPDIGFTFANALRSILRQDPDIIMIGEIRDIETASIAIQSSLTGHFVLSTLHTNSALGAITRLLDMGVEFFLLKSSIRGLMAQRLVRKLCPYCKKEISLDKDMKDFLKIDNVLKKYPLIEFPKFYAPVGCKHCAFTGYKGRIPVTEIVPFSDEVQFFIEKDKNFNDLSKIGVRSLFEDAILKFAEGKTSYQEILKVV